MSTRIATLSPNPAIDETARVSGFTAGRVNRVEWERCDAGGKGVNVASFLADAGLPVVTTGLSGSANAEPFVELFALYTGMRPTDGQIRRASAYARC